MSVGNPLLDAVDALTKPRIEHVLQYGDDGTWLKAHTTTCSPLLQQLEDAIASSIGSGGRREGSHPSSMNVLDSEALFEFTKIRSQIGDWCHMRKVERTGKVTMDLRRWYVAHTVRDGREDGFYINLLWGWVYVIKSKLDPPRRIEIQTPCPVCSAAKWEGVEDELLFPLVVEYHDYGSGESIKPRALCRACETVWDGVGAIEELADELKEKVTE